MDDNWLKISKLFDHIDQKNVSVTLSNGKAGQLLMYYFLYKIHKSAELKHSIDKLVIQIEDGLENIDVNNFLSFNNGVVGVAWVLSLLQKDRLYSNKKFDFNDIDRTLSDKILKKKNKRLDFNFGIIGYGYYFLVRSTIYRSRTDKDFLMDMIINEALIHLVDDLEEALRDAPFPENEKLNIESKDYLICCHYLLSTLNKNKIYQEKTSALIEKIEAKIGKDIELATLNISFNNHNLNEPFLYSPSVLPFLNYKQSKTEVQVNDNFEFLRMLSEALLNNRLKIVSSGLSGLGGVGIRLISNHYNKMNKIN